eukprot:TRINITY_DN39819_c0_g1_i1.p1 TRINITY_DN39819_c0_g1~~TRINITY_DN39819_c0_g1_i1.p1  ORF type:complete len:133 (-),score=23.16 TRINITY_DN39819_c0_g1_i1:211-609(-)
MNIAAGASANSLDYFGFGTVFVPSFDYSEAFRYYRHCTIGSISPEFQLSDVLRLVCEFATETYRRHQLVDLQDRTLGWCAAEIRDVQYPLVQVRYTGWRLQVAANGSRSLPKELLLLSPSRKCSLKVKSVKS